MQNLKSVLVTTILTTTGGQAIAAANALATGQVIARGSYYALTPKAARTMNIDFAGLTKSLDLQSHQQLAFQIQEDGELDLSIYENGVFSTLKSDLTK